MSTLHRWTRTAVRVATTLTRTPAGSQRALHCTRSRLLTAHEVPPVVLQHTSSAASSSSASTPVPPPSREPINPEEYARQQHGFTDGADEDGIEQEDEQAYRAPEDPERVALKKRLLSTAVGSVAHNGWSVEALEAACAELDLPRSTIGDLCPAGPVELVYYTMDDARQRMATHFAGDAAFASEPTHTKVERAMRWRLEQNIPYIQQWSQALALCAQPQQLVTSACKMSEFVNDLAYLCGDDATDFHWYAKRCAYTAVYASAELYMLTDHSHSYSSTWRFLKRRLKDARQAEQMPEQAQVAVQHAAKVGMVFLQRLTQGPRA